MADSGNHGGIRMWPSLATASWLYDLANAALIGALIIGAASTVLIVWMGNVKETYLRRDVALLNKAAELLRQDNDRLEAQLSPRKLRPEQMQAIANALAPFKGTVVRVQSYALDVESAFLAKQIEGTLGIATIAVDDNILSQSALGVLDLGVHVTGDNESLVAALVKALNDQGILAFPTAPTPGAGMSLGHSNVRVDATIFVGARPPK